MTGTASGNSPSSEGSALTDPIGALNETIDVEFGLIEPYGYATISTKMWGAADAMVVQYTGGFTLPYGWP